MAVQQLLKYGVLLGSFLVAGLFFGHTALPRLFSDDSAVVTRAGSTLMVIAFSMVSHLSAL